MRAQQHEVSLIAFAQEAAQFDIKETGWGVAHEFNEARHREYALVDQFKHGDERKLHHRHAGERFGRTADFLVDGVWGVVGGDGGGWSVVQCFA